MRIKLAIVGRSDRDCLLRQVQISEKRGQSTFGRGNFKDKRYDRWARAGSARLGNAYAKPEAARALEHANTRHPMKVPIL